MDVFINCLLLELHERKSEWIDHQFDTIYFGGGTPSILSEKDLLKIFKTIYKEYKISVNPEITIELNPDDTNREYLKFLGNETPVNRLSIGIQSFHPDDLLLMNRRHNAGEAIRSLRESQAAGFHNISIDLIYGIPGMDINRWEKNLDIAISMEIPHLSAYHLTFEPKTVFEHYRKKGKLSPIDENQSNNQLELLINKTSEKEFEHYEISNFAKNKMYSRHNLGYWTDIPYAGFGPSAHSYNGKIRRWNISNNTAYAKSLITGDNNYYDIETLDERKYYNEYILTSLRTMWGIDLEMIKRKFGENYATKSLETAKKFEKSHQINISGTKVTISPSGILQADYIISEFFQV